MQTRRKSRLQKIARELLSITMVVVGILAARSSLADHYFVPSGSMEHTLYAGDRVLVDKRAYGLRIPFTNYDLLAGDRVQRGDVVIFDSPVDGKRLIKRIVAVGGDDVAIIDGRVAVNGRPVGDDEVERFGLREALLNLEHGGGPDFVARVPAGRLLAVGDHRGNSNDGRMFGLVEENGIYGRAIAIYYRSDQGLVWRRL